ncbi:hypothetical protein C6I20_02885 [Aeromicrobium sp. A1-2]|uniref:hypothetical protein n=1 Tax=Aeromicrobium sp. A1-2 TaxID=2107713 RepID=UPI000E4E6A57|nr:hypothetical protein [Aeromicrobium sp. A1-2]AXT84240.1 hypothetical protein C6I20_02885 [Aeromicrobium sp. A1-2]
MAAAQLAPAEHQAADIGAIDALLGIDTTGLTGPQVGVLGARTMVVGAGRTLAVAIILYSAIWQVVRRLRPEPVLTST